MLYALLLFSALAVRADAPSLEALPVRSSITIDGHLDEADWETAAPATGFLQARPLEGSAPSQQTEVRVLFSDDALYLGARMFDSEPSKIQRTLGRRDAFNQADWFMAAIDGYHDRKTALFFAVNAAGVQVDGTLSGNDDDLSWDALWASSVRVDEQGWTAELRIPYSMLRFSGADVQTWGINFRREIPRTAEEVEWSLVRREDQARGVVAGFGTLEGLRGIRPQRTLQVTPYVLTGAQVDEQHRALPDAELDANVGADVKIGLAPNVTLDLTVNPDFGQVEADPATLNLSAFEVVLRERRPFFVEGLDIFQLSDNDSEVLYTRRIGSQAPIIGAAKLTGRTQQGLSFGVLGATTGDRFSPDRAYGAARARQTLGRDSRVGLIGTYFDGTLGGQSHRRAWAGVGDWDLRFLGNTHAVSGRVGVSHRRTQDAPFTTGFSGAVGVQRISGIWQWQLSASISDDRYNLNDAGRLRRNNTFGFSGRISHEINGGRPFGWFNRGSVRLFSGNTFTYTERRNQGLGVFFFGNLTTRGYQDIRFNIFSDYLFGGYDPYETRGLDPRAQPLEVRVRLGFETDSRRSWTLEPNAELEVRGDGGRDFALGLEADARINDRIQIGAEVDFGREDGRVAWVDNEAFRRTDTGWEIGRYGDTPDNLGPTDYAPFDDGDALTALLASRAPYDALGTHYLSVFGARDGRTFDASLRTTAMFTTNLSLQLYAQLFAARGRYRAFKLLTSPDDLPPFDAYPKRQAYQVASFQLNTVVRWQYRPGSTLYVVWTQARSNSLDQDPFAPDAPYLYDTSTGQQLADAFDLYPTNLLLIKLTYTMLR